MDLIFIIIIAAGIVYTIAAGLLLIIDRSKRINPPHSDGVFKPVTILKPLKGVDDQLRANLQSFFELDYPEFELVFGVAEREDSSVPIVRELMEEFVGVSARLVVDSSEIGLNPKVNNLNNIYAAARHGILVVSDSNVRVDRDYLKDLVHHLAQPGVGLVTSTIRGVGATSLGSMFENLHLNTYIASSVVAVKRFFRIQIAIGKSMCFRRSTLEKIGGFAAVSSYLAEDFELGKRVHSLGMSIRVSSRHIDSVNETWTLAKFWNRHYRWAQMRRQVNLLHYLAEVTSNPIMIAAIYLAAAHSTLAAATFAATACLKILIDYIIGRSLDPATSFGRYLLVPVKDLVIAGIWFVPLFNRVVGWRGHKFLIGKHTKLEPIISEDGRKVPVTVRMPFLAIPRAAYQQLKRVI